MARGQPGEVVQTKARGRELNRGSGVGGAAGGQSLTSREDLILLKG